MNFEIVITTHPFDEEVEIAKLTVATEATLEAFQAYVLGLLLHCRDMSTRVKIKVVCEDDGDEIFYADLLLAPGSHTLIELKEILATAAAQISAKANEPI